MARGLLQFTIRSATNLHKHDVFGRQQPYCQVDCGGYSCKSKIAKDGGQNPVWEQTLFFQVNNEKEVIVTILAEHQVFKDAVLGTAVVPIISVRQTGVEELSVAVMRKGCESGVLHVTLEFKGPALTNYGQVGQVLATRSALPCISAQGASYRQGSVSSSSSQDGPVRLASMPIRLLQQPTSPLLASQQQHQQQHQQQQQQVPAQPQQQQPPQQGLQQGPQGSDPAAAAVAAAEARGLVLQRQLSPTVSGPLDVTTLQQMYSQQLQQLQMVQAQLLRTLPPEQRMAQQQQLLEQLSGGATQQATGQQQQQLQQQGLPGRQGAEAAAAAGRGGRVQLPKQPKKTAADLFKPVVGPSGLDSSFQHLLAQGDDDDDDVTGLSDATGLSNPDLLSSLGISAVPGGFDMTRLQAIIAKVYPDPSSGAPVPQSTTAVGQQQQQQAGGPSAAAAAAGPSVTAPLTAGAPAFQPNSIGAFGAAAALAAAAAGVAYEGDTNSSIGLGGFGGVAGMAAAAAATAGATADDSSSIGLGGFGGAAGMAAAAAAAAREQVPAALPAGSSAAAAGDSYPGTNPDFPRSFLDTTVGSQTPSVRSSVCTPTTLPYSSQSNRSADLAMALSSVTATTIPPDAPSAGVTHMRPAGDAAAAQQGQVQPELAAALAEEIARVKAAAPLLAQILGLAPAGTAPAAAATSGAESLVDSGQAAGAPVSKDPAAPTAAHNSVVGTGTVSRQQLPATEIARKPAESAAASESNARVVELERLLAAAYQAQAQLIVQLQERDYQLQLLLQQYTNCQQELAALRAQLAKQQQGTN